MNQLFFISLVLILSVSPLIGETTNDSYLAFRQQAEADCIVLFHSWEEYQIEKPKQSDSKILPGKDPLNALIASLPKKNFVVIIMDKRCNLHKAPISDQVDALLPYFREKGFKRIIFQQAAGYSSPTGLPILRDVENEKKT